MKEIIHLQDLSATTFSTLVNNVNYISALLKQYDSTPSVFHCVDAVEKLLQIVNLEKERRNQINSVKSYRKFLVIASFVDSEKKYSSNFTSIDKTNIIKDICYCQDVTRSEIKNIYIIGEDLLIHEQWSRDADDF
jgi:hypothetical protein